MLNSVQRIIPTILATSQKEFEDRLKSVENLVDLVHLDIADGRFVPSVTWPNSEAVGGYPWVCQFALHLMIEKPEDILPDWINARPAQIIVQLESTERLVWVVNNLRDNGIEAGVALRLETPLESVRPFLEEVDMVLLLAGQPGFNGAAFDPKIIDRVTALRQMWPSGKIGVDIGMHEATLPQVAKAGASVFMVGSEIAQAADVAKKIQELEALI